MTVDAKASQRYREGGWWRDQTFLDDLRRNAGQRPDHPAVIGYLGGPDRTETVTWAQLAGHVEAVACALVGLGIQPGEYVAMQLHDCWEVLAIALGAIRAGARVSPIPPEYRRAELDFMLKLTGARLLITATELEGARAADVALAIRRAGGQPEHIAIVGGGGPDGTLDFAARFLARPPDPAAVLAGREPTRPDDPFLILFTSGTTGENKGAMHSQNTLFASIRAFTEALNLDESLVFITPHTCMAYVGLSVRLFTALVLGGTAVCADDDAPAITLELTERHGITLFYGAPSYVRRLLAGQDPARPRDVSSLRLVVSGSAPIPPRLLHQVRDVLGVRMFSLWGMTENGAVTITRPSDPEDWPAHSDGSPAGGMEVRLDAAAGRVDGAGELWVRGPAMCLGYYRRDEVFAASVDADGWFDTGDLASDDGRGGIRLVGRAKDVIVFRASKVPVAQIENVLGTHPKVADIALIGIPDPAVDERVCAVVTVSGGTPPTLAELRDYLSDSGVSTWFWPERLEVVDEMPRTAMGKVRKVELRQRFPTWP